MTTSSTRKARADYIRSAMRQATRRTDTTTSQPTQIVEVPWLAWKTVADAAGRYAERIERGE